MSEFSTFGVSPNLGPDSCCVGVCFVVHAWFRPGGWSSRVRYLQRPTCRFN